MLTAASVAAAPRSMENKNHTNRKNGGWRGTREKVKCRGCPPFICLLAYYFTTVPTSLGAPLRERRERFVIVAPAVCLPMEGKISFKTIFKLIIV